MVRMEERLVSRDVHAEGSVDLIINHFFNVSRHQKLTQQRYCPDLKTNLRWSKPDYTNGLTFTTRTITSSLHTTVKLVRIEYSPCYLVKY